MTKKAPKPKKCKACLTFFTPRNSLQVVCSVLCAVGLNQRRKEKEAKKQNREAKAKLKTKSQWLKEAQTAFNAYIRSRDRMRPCISCGRWHEGQWHAGHYRSIGAEPSLRLNEDNCHKQCAPCNNHKSGNITLYRQNLICKIGLARVEALEAKIEPKKYTIPEIVAIKALYKQKCKELE